MGAGRGGGQKEEKSSLKLTMSRTVISLKENTRALGPVAEGRQKAREADIVPVIIRYRGLTCIFKL